MCSCYGSYVGECVGLEKMPSRLCPFIRVQVRQCEACACQCEISVCDITLSPRMVASRGGVSFPLTILKKQFSFL